MVERTYNIFTVYSIRNILPDRTVFSFSLLSYSHLDRIYFVYSELMLSCTCVCVCLLISIDIIHCYLCTLIHREPTQRAAQRLLRFVYVFHSL